MGGVQGDQQNPPINVNYSKEYFRIADIYKLQTLWNDKYVKMFLSVVGHTVMWRALHLVLLHCSHTHNP